MYVCSRQSLTFDVGKGSLEQHHDQGGKEMKSFRVCGISMKTDGSEDGKSHCIKEGQIAAEASPTSYR